MNNIFSDWEEEPVLYKELSSWELMDVDQKIKGDLIYTLHIIRNKTYIVKYEKDGLYDAILNNFKEHSSELELFENEKYDWNALLKSEIKDENTIYLCRPDKKPLRKRFEFNKPKSDIFKHGYKLVNVVKLRRFVYRSSYYPEIIGYTYGEITGKRIINPIKILEHDWERCSFGKYKYYDSNILGWTCKKCSMKGYSYSSEKKAIYPNDLLTCDEVMIKDILL